MEIGLNLANNGFKSQLMIMAIKIVGKGDLAEWMTKGIMAKWHCGQMATK